MYTYNYKIIPKIHINASVSEGPITEDYAPTLTITLDYSKRKLALTGLTNTKTGSIGHHETTETAWNFYGISPTVRNMRYTTYTMIMITTCLSITVGLLTWYLQTRKTPPFMTTLKKEYREKIVESTEPLPATPEKITVKLKNLEDLIKVSEETLKPIIHETTTIQKGKVKRHTLYVLDADIKYELVVEEPTEPST